MFDQHGLAIMVRYAARHKRREQVGIVALAFSLRARSFGFVWETVIGLA